MSGGHFDYVQYRIEQAADELQNYLDKIAVSTESYHQYSDETKQRMVEAVAKIREAAIYLNRIDWFISGDDSEESFHRRLNEQLSK